MARYNKLSEKEKLRLVTALCQVISATQDTQEAAKLLTDLLSPAEIEIVAKRLEIARLLLKGLSYDQIREKIAVGYSTIARVNTWLNLAGDGFKIAVKRIKEEKNPPSIDEKQNPFSWYNFGRRYPTRIWPLLAIEKFLETANRKEKSKLVSILQSMESKKQIFTKETNREFYNQFSEKITFEKQNLVKKDSIKIK